MRSLVAADERTNSQRLISWLYTTDVVEIHNEALRLMEPETGNWLLESDALKEWQSLPGSLCWLHGIR